MLKNEKKKIGTGIDVFSKFFIFFISLSYSVFLLSRKEKNKMKSISAFFVIPKWNKKRRDFCALLFLNFHLHCMCELALKGLLNEKKPFVWYIFENLNLRKGIVSFSVLFFDDISLLFKICEEK
jgi:hypothetical protein